ncbi:FMN-binding protein [Methylogaea oryzae]|uniref:FMN-binding protein n=1 Tax=Methylogaea oryzae TaxID=1295382 RepID=A0A8D4VSI8_9GAMM|nr:FMN-binding protein [Methylogaea oryzae]BBL71734.1 FMN-binding protein [Methylogaea oryzae]
MRRTLAIGLTLLALTAGNANAVVYYSKEEAFQLAFGEGATVETKPLFLSDAQTAQIEQLAQAKLESQLYTFYVGKRGEQVLGYAAIETHTVRSHPETLLLVLSPAGELEKVEVLAFHEPPEYQPPQRWYNLLLKKPLEAMRLGNGIDAISGATLSTRSAVDSARKVLAVYRTALAGNPH